MGHGFELSELRILVNSMAKFTSLSHQNYSVHNYTKFSLYFLKFRDLLMNFLKPFQQILQPGGWSVSENDHACLRIVGVIVIDCGKNGSHWTRILPGWKYIFGSDCNR